MSTTGSLIGLAGLFFIMIPLLIHISLGVWVYRDARRRGRSAEYAIVALLAVLMFPVVGIIVYLFIRYD
ncbi:phospholipase D nuclease [Paenibacillus sp. 32O-W]|uniref:hypothetical protein n=1 Tax=Paenibacillus sp. 32O-W TaxID=1695218 RepID=UPI00071EDC31|nr:hypothetical protein [Paenibacillus sp. 32O-W]ALS28153.1 phospholipase D nuclease [Paenibacillus sp. 32O-W]